MCLAIWLVCLIQAEPVHSEHESLPTSKQLNTHITATWKGQELGIVLERLAANQGVVFWIDRRVDPQQIVDAQFHDTSLSKVLDTLTNPQDLGWKNLGPLCYVGPREAGREIATLLTLARDSVERLPAAKRKLWEQEAPASWPRLAEPRTVLAEWLSHQGIKFKGAELITHDLWPSSDTPPLPLYKRIVLLLVGFDRTCRISPDGDTCTVVPIERPVTITRVYEAGPKTRSAIAEMRRSDTGLQITQQSRGVTATGRWEDQLKLARLLSDTKLSRQKQKSSQQKLGQKLFSLRLENQPLGKVISQIAGQVDLEVVWEEDLIQSTPDPRLRLITCEVVKADLPSLVGQIIDSAGLDYHLEERKLIIRNPDKEHSLNSGRKPD